MWELAASTGLDLNSPYAYVMWAEYHGETSLVAEGVDGELAGFVTGFRVPADPEVVFVWQIGVAAGHRGRGLAGHLLDELVARTRCRFVEATVTPSNAASDALFRALGRRHGAATVRTDACFGEELFPDAHEAEVRYRIGPLRAGGTTEEATERNEERHANLRPT